MPEGFQIVAAFLHSASFSAKDRDSTVTLSSGDNAVTVANDDGDGVTTENEFISLGETMGSSDLEAFRANVTGFVSNVIEDRDIDAVRDIAALDGDGFLMLDFGNGDTLTFVNVDNVERIIGEVSFIRGSTTEGGRRAIVGPFLVK